MVQVPIGLDELELDGQNIGLVLRNGSPATKRKAVKWMLDKFNTRANCDHVITEILDNGLVPVLMEIMASSLSIQLQEQTARLICCMTAAPVNIQLRLINCGLVPSIVASMQSTSLSIISSSLWALYNFVLYEDDTSAALLRFDGVFEQVVCVANMPTIGFDKRLLTAVMACIGNYMSLRPEETRQTTANLLPLIKLFLDDADDMDAVYCMLLGCTNSGTCAASMKMYVLLQIIDNNSLHAKSPTQIHFTQNT